MTRIFLSIVIMSFGCGEESASLPSGAVGSEDAGTPSDGDGDGDGDGGSSTDCGDDWEIIDDEVAINPETCREWSPRSASPMDWYAAASTADGEAGSCGSDCPEPGISYCDSISGLAGLNWRLPSKRELLDAGQTQPDIPDTDKKLWSRDTNSASVGSAWTVDLSRGGGTGMSLTKTDTQVYVRCVSDD